MGEREQERQWIERVKEGDTAAFRMLLDRHKEDAYSLSLSILKDPALAEDVLQEAFIKVYDKIGSFQYQSTFSTWLYRIVVNRAYNELKKRKRFIFATPEPTMAQEGAADLVNKNDVKEAVNLALAQMKADEALVLKLFYLSELKIEEVMEITGFGKSKVKVSLHRGRKSFEKALKKILGKEIGEIL